MNNIHITRENKLDYQLMFKQAVVGAARGFNAKFEYFQHYSARKAAEDEL